MLCTTGRKLYLAVAKTYLTLPKITGYQDRWIWPTHLTLKSWMDELDTVIQKLNCSDWTSQRMPATNQKSVVMVHNSTISCPLNQPICMGVMVHNHPMFPDYSAPNFLYVTFWRTNPKEEPHADGKASFSICSFLGSFTFVARPTASKPRITHQVGSSCHHSRPWRAEYSKAWWLLCQPSPNASIATHLKQNGQDMLLWVIRIWIKVVATYVDRHWGTNSVTLCTTRVS